MKHTLRSSLFRILRVTIVVLVLIGGAIWLRRMLSSLESEQAVINAEIMQVRTPINGVLEIKEVRPGMQLKKGDTLFKVTNPLFGDRESVSQYNTLETQVETLRSELTSARRDLEVATAERERERILYKRQLTAAVTKDVAETRVISIQKLVAAKTEQLSHASERALEMEAQMKLQKESVVTAPEDGVIWSITGKSGEQVNSNALVMEVINPSRIWVDAFFSESHSRELRPGLPATIRSLDNARSWHGHLQSIRAGVGRMAYDTTVAVPPPDMAKRQIAVRVDADWERPFSAVEFFGVGRSVEVAFARGSGQRTVGDVLKEKWDRLLKPAKATANAQAAE